MKHKLIPIAVAVLFILAAAVAFYPLVSNALAERNRSIVRTEYIEQIEQTDDAALETILAAAQEYNAALTGVFDPTRSAEGYYDQLAISESGIMGYIEIPRIGVYLPIYHGTDADTLDVGVGHLIGSSLPVGGSGTHTVLSAHSGLARENMFSDLDQLVAGDVFYLHVLGQTLAYAVDEINTVLPEDTSKLGIESEQDYCTLIICTPFGVNTHRLLVRGSRVEYKPEAISEQKQASVEIRSTWQQEYIRGIVIGLSAAAVFAVVLLLPATESEGSMKGIKICLFLLLIAGLAVALFPVGNGLVTEYQMTQQAQSFIAKTELLPAFTEAVQSANENDERCPRHHHRRQSVPQRRQSRGEIAVS